MCIKYFEIHTYKYVLTSLLGYRLVTACMTHWIVDIQEHDFTTQYIKISNNKLADTLR